MKRIPMKKRRIMVMHKKKGSLQWLLLAGVVSLGAAGVQAQGSDSARIIVVGGVNRDVSLPLPPNRDFTFNTKVQYSLGSLDAAVLYVDVEEFEETAGVPGGCMGPVHSTNGGSSVPIRRASVSEDVRRARIPTVDAQQPPTAAGKVPVQLGAGEVMVKVTWNGAHSVYGAKTKFIGLFVTFSDPQTKRVIFNTFPPQPSQCFAVGVPELSPDERKAR
jgi:hypothetical protein